MASWWGQLPTMDAPGQASPPHAETAPAATRDAAMGLLLRLGDATASDLASRLGVSVQAMRRHLRCLEEEGLLEASPTHDGPGRPSNRWRLTAAGRGRFPDGSEHFALGLMQSLAASLPSDTLRTLLQDQALAKAADYRQQLGAGPLPERLERLVELRRREGYVAECRAESGNDAAPSWLLSEFHCSVMRIAEQFPQVCDQELQLMRHTFPDCRVDRVHWRLDAGHSCGFRISPDR